MNKLIVESINDQYFIEALIQHLHINVEVDTPICKIDEFECLDGLDEKKLILKIEDLLDEVAKKGLEKIGILIDIDNFSVQERLNFTCQSINKALKNKGFPLLEHGFETINQFIKVTVDEATSVEIGCFFTNLNGQGELETVLKAIKTQDSMYADCLDSWRNCIIEKGKSLSQKEFDKFWLSNYIRFDTCSKKEKYRAGTYCTLENVLKNKIHVFDLNSSKLLDLKAFLLLFK